MSVNMIPILRSFDEAKAREFYVDFLGFTVDWEHRFAENAPLYMQVSKGLLVLHLSEHHGDCSPGGAVRVETHNVDALGAELRAKRYKYANPGCGQLTPWGTKELTLTDPFKNRLIFWETADTTRAGGAAGSETTNDQAGRRRYMVIERFRDPAAVYRRFRERGRLAPNRLLYVSSWVTDDVTRCFQVMECDDEQQLKEWIENWSDLVEFEVIPVLSSEQAAAKLDRA
jgi:catechol 2,3-dioxygenase-like lactoylglutathione lyase family enzyme